MPKKPKFEPGETAILLHNEGGRLAVIHETTDEGVFERICDRTFSTQQQYVSPRRESEFLKVENRDDAIRAVARFEEAKYQREAAIADVRRQFQQDLKRIRGEYELWEDDDV